MLHDILQSFHSKDFVSGLISSSSAFNLEFYLFPITLISMQQDKQGHAKTAIVGKMIYNSPTAGSQFKEGMHFLGIVLEWANFQPSFLSGIGSHSA